MNNYKKGKLMERKTIKKNKFFLISLLLGCIFTTDNQAQNTEDVFTKIYEKNYWNDNESVSGHGSNLISTKFIRKEIPSLLKKLDVKTMLDAPCGDFYWMKKIINQLDLDQYIGADIVADLITKNNQRFGKENITFVQLNVINNPLPKVDLILCRDCLLHFSYKDIISAFKNFKMSGAKYILMTHFSKIKHRKFVDITTGDWRPINFNQPPFNLPEAEHIIVEHCPQSGFPDKCLALWELSKIVIDN